jgi:hypothetical protein
MAPSPRSVFYINGLASIVFLPNNPSCHRLPITYVLYPPHHLRLPLPRLLAPTVLQENVHRQLSFRLLQCQILLPPEYVAHYLQALYGVSHRQ